MLSSFLIQGLWKTDIYKMEMWFMPYLHQWKTWNRLLKYQSERLVKAMEAMWFVATSCSRCVLSILVMIQLMMILTAYMVYGYCCTSWICLILGTSFIYEIHWLYLILTLLGSRRPFNTFTFLKLCFLEVALMQTDVISQRPFYVHYTKF